MKEKGVYWTTGKKHKPLTTCTTLTTYYLIHLSSYNLCAQNAFALPQVGRRSS